MVTTASMGDRSIILLQMTAMSSQHITELSQLKQQNKLLHLQLLQQFQPIPRPNPNEKKNDGEVMDLLVLKKTKKYITKLTLCVTLVNTMLKRSYYHNL